MRKKEWFLVLAILFLAIFSRSLFLSQIKSNLIFNLFPGSDSLNYYQWSKHIKDEGIFHKSLFYGMPLYAYFLAVIYKIFSLNLWAVRIIQLLMGITNCFLAYLLAKRLFNLWVGFLAGILMAIYPMFIFYEILIMPPTLVIFLNILAALSALEVLRNPSKKNFFLFGIILGSIGLVEPAIFLFALFFLIWQLYSAGNRQKPKTLFISLIFLAGLFTLPLLNSLRNYVANQDFVFVSAHSGINFFIGNNPSATGAGDIPSFLRPSQKGHLEDARLVAEEILGHKLKPSEVSGFWFKQSFNFIRWKSFDYLKLLFRKLLIFWNGFEPIDTAEFSFLEGRHLFFLLLNSFAFISSLCLLGMIICFKQFSRLAVLYLFILSLMFSAVLFFVTARYRLSAVPFMIIFSGFSIYWFYQKIKDKQTRRFLYGLIGLALLFYLINQKDVSLEKSNAKFYFDRHYNQGVLKLEQGNFKEAVKELDLAASFNPLDYLAHFALANAYYAKKEFKAALEEYKISLRINPRFPDGHFNLGHLYQETGDLTNAEKEFKEVLNLSPEAVDAHYKLATIYKTVGSYKEAISHFQKIMHMEPSYKSAIEPLIEDCQRFRAE